MTDPNPYDYSDYKVYFVDLMKVRQALFGPRAGILSSLARAARCHRSFVTQVLKSKLHLNPDQMFRICIQLKLNERQSTYLLALLELSRATDPDYRSHVQRRLDRIRRKRDVTSDESGKSIAETLRAVADSLERGRAVLGAPISTMG